MKKFFISFIVLLLIGFIGTSFFVFFQKEEKQPEKEDVPVLEDTPKEDEKKTAKLTFVGDLLFETAYYNAIDQGEDQNLYFSLVKDYFQNDDLSIGN